MAFNSLKMAWVAGLGGTRERLLVRGQGVVDHLPRSGVLLDGLVKAVGGGDLAQGEALVPHRLGHPRQVRHRWAGLGKVFGRAREQEAQLLVIDLLVPVHDAQAHCEGEQELVLLEQAATHGLVEELREAVREELQALLEDIGPVRGENGSTTRM